MKLITKRTRKTTTQTCAAQAADPATPENPKIAAIMAITKNVKAQPIMACLLLLKEVARRISKTGAVPYSASF